MRRTRNDLLNELHTIIDRMGGGTVNYNGAGYTVTLYSRGTYYADTFTGIKKLLNNI